MSTLTTLIKLSEQKLEAKQEEISKLDAQVQKMKEREKELHKTIKNGFGQAEKSHSVMMLTQASKFSEHAALELEDIQEAKVLSKKIRREKVKEMNLLFSEKKRYEILEERRIKENKMKISKKQQEFLDDLTSTKEAIKYSQ